MINSKTCRAARALVNWTQQQLATAGNVGVSTVKNFEAGHTTPTANNLNALQRALEHAGVEFLSEEHRGHGVIAHHLRLRAYFPGEGLVLEFEHTEPLFDSPDNTFWLAFKISEEALTLLAGRPISDDDDAKAVAWEHEGAIVGAVKRSIAKNGLSVPGAKAREIDLKDFRALRESKKEQQRQKTG